MSQETERLWGSRPTVSSADTILKVMVAATMSVTSPEDFTMINTYPED